MTDYLTGIPDRAEVDDESAALPADPDTIALAYAADETRQAYLAVVRAGLPERLGTVLTWLEDQADFYQQDSGGDPRFAPTDPRAQDYGDPFTILDDAAARIEFSFNVGDRDLGWRDGAMLSSEELGDLRIVLDNQIWTLENQPDFAANVAVMLRGVVAALTEFRTRTVTGCSRPVETAVAGVPAAAAAAAAPASHASHAIHLTNTPTAEEA